MHHDHLLPHHAYLKNEIPVAGVAHQAGTCRFGKDPATSVLDRRLPRARGRQPLRRRHELLPEHRRGEPRADGDGERAAGRRPPARAPRGGRVAPGGDAMPPEHHVIVVGGGFAGVGCARRLAKHEDVRVTLLDRNNYHQFQPLLYQVATSQLASSDVAYSLRKLFSDNDERRRQARRRRVGRPGDAHGDHRRRPDVHRRRHRPGRRIAAQLLPHAGGAGARVPALLARRRAAAALARSSGSSRTPTATRRCSTRAR